MTDDIKSALEALKTSMLSLQLATISEEGEPHCGYTPFIINGADFYIFVSQLSLHTRDLLSTRRAGVMLIADEQNSSQIYARTRVNYQCTASVISQEEEHYDSLLDALRERQGKMVDLIRQLPDFILFRLTPTSGQFVMGLGKAYRLSGENLDVFEHAKSA
ncbi:MAG: pyridoxamine 5'-phosphate oxidase family protein [Granulosicoccus sp.]